MDTWWKSKLQLKSNLEFNWIWTSIFTFNNSFGTKLKIKWDTWRKIENLIKLKISISPGVPRPSFANKLYYFQS